MVRALAAAHPMAVLTLSVRAFYRVCFAPTLPANTVALHPFLWQRPTRTTAWETITVPVSPLDASLLGLTHCAITACL